MFPVGPDPFEFSGFGVVAQKRAAGDRHPIQQADQQSTVRRRQLGFGHRQPGQVCARRAAVSLRVLDGQLGQQRLRQRITVRRRDESQLRAFGHHNTIKPVPR